MSQDSCTITGPLGIVLRISSMVGIAPINLTRTPCGYVGTVSPGRPFCKYIAIFLLAISTTFCFLIQFLPQLTGVNIEISIWSKQIEDMVQLSISAFIPIIAIFNGSIRVKQTIKYLNQIEEVNIKLECDTGDINNNYKLFVSCYLVLSGCKIVGFIWAIYVAACAVKVAYVVQRGLQMILFLAVVLIEMQFVFKVCLLNETLRVLNKKLYALICKYDLSGSVMTFSTVDYIEARNYCRIYLTIRHIIYKINKQEELILMLLVILYFNNTNNFVHYLTASIDLDLPIISVIINIGMLIVWLITIILSLFLTVEPYHQISQEVQKIHNLLGQLMSTSMERQLSKEFSIFSQQYLQQCPVFCPFGMVTLTRPLLLKMGGSVLTYVSLVSQFNLRGEESFLKI